jgi:hypothetical protein
MSQSRQCTFFKAVDQQWYCRLGDYEYAYEDHQCTVYGPFTTIESAEKYVRDYFANPGCSETDDSGTEPVPADPVRPRR